MDTIMARMSDNQQEHKLDPEHLKPRYQLQEIRVDGAIVLKFMEPDNVNVLFLHYYYYYYYYVSSFVYNQSLIPSSAVQENLLVPQLVKNFIDNNGTQGCASLPQSANGGWMLERRKVWRYLSARESFISFKTYHGSRQKNAQPCQS